MASFNKFSLSDNTEIGILTGDPPVAPNPVGGPWGPCYQWIEIMGTGVFGDLISDQPGHIPSQWVRMLIPCPTVFYGPYDPGSSGNLFGLGEIIVLPPNPLDPPGCTDDDTKALKQALDWAKSVLRKSKSKLYALKQCDQDGKMQKLIDCLMKEGLNSDTPDMSCGTIVTNNVEHKDAEGHTFTDGSLRFNLKLIKKDANDDPNMTQSHLNLDMLHELVHRCGPQPGSDLIRELDVMIITKMLGFPRTDDIYDNYFKTIVNESKTPGGVPPWYDTNFFSWNSDTGEVFCYNGSEGVRIFGGPNQPILKRH